MTDQATTIPKGWKMTTLGQQIKVGRGSSPRPIQDFLSDGGIPWVKIADASASETRYIVKTKEFIKEEGRSTSVKIGDLIVSNSATPGIPKFMGIDACVHDGWLVFSEYKDLDKLFLYYFFLDYRRTLEHSASGTVFVNLQTEIVRSIDLNLPPLPEQRAIAAVLSSLDDKIELLREQNKTLEATAQAIFKEWFVNFNFPGATGKMIDSELGEIPEGWSVVRLGDEVETVLGGTPNTEKKEYWENGNIPWINSGKVNDFRIYEPTSYITEKALNESAAKLMPKGTVVIAITGATLGQVSRLEIESTGNQSVIGILPNDKFSSAYLFYWMLENVSTIINTATGGAQQHINKNDVNGFDFIVPTNDILKKYYEAVNPMTEKISNNCFQIQTLSKLRNTLLPKLMKGEIRVRL